MRLGVFVCVWMYKQISDFICNFLQFSHPRYWSLAQALLMCTRLSAVDGEETAKKVVYVCVCLMCLMCVKFKIILVILTTDLFFKSECKAERKGLSFIKRDLVGGWAADDLAPTLFHVIRTRYGVTPAEYIESLSLGV